MSYANLGFTPDVYSNNKLLVQPYSVVFQADTQVLTGNTISYHNTGATGATGAIGPTGGVGSANVGTAFGNSFAIYRHLASGGQGGQGVINTWTTRSVNHVEGNAPGIGLGVGPSMVVPAGTWYVRAYATAYQTQNHQTRLFNRDSSLVIVFTNGLAAYGTTEFSNTSATKSYIEGIFTLGITAQLNLQTNVAFSTGITDFGASCAAGTPDNQSYSCAYFTRVF